ncbi:DUF4402 domain-containing protein [candidate division GN15 bacterium]|nr:DUF4402 domain-containing protein [candidate division GN15 bacterium]
MTAGVRKLNRRPESGMHRQQFAGIRITRLIVAAVLVAAGMPSLASADDVAIGTATATVVAAITVSATATLDFGTVYQGVPVAIANDNASAAIFTITGSASANILIFFQLPEYLSLSDNSDRMDIVFDATDCSVDSTGSGTPGGAWGGGWPDVSPHALPSGTAIGGGGATSVYLGGTVRPRIGQKAGSYEADIVITVAYEGT